MEKLIKKIELFKKERQWEKFHTPKNISMALSTEVSEIIEIFQWMSEQESYILSNEEKIKLREEIGDVVIYLFELANYFKIYPLEAALDKIKINEKKYPADIVKGKSNKYTDYT
ncbi:MAG: nucleotide pyrophosphohydrolase [Candidatus Marinimicrobia bacterium]|nr:nucleotide pyrophosphohydrolase [Candidatus Neomarinimicrobiota bacterium]